MYFSKPNPIIIRTSTLNMKVDERLSMSKLVVTSHKPPKLSMDSLLAGYVRVGVNDS